MGNESMRWLGASNLLCDVQLSPDIIRLGNHETGRTCPTSIERNRLGRNRDKITGLNDDQSLREELQNLNKKFSLLTTSIESIKEKNLTLTNKYEKLNKTSDLLVVKVSSLQNKYQAQKKLVERVSENNLAADAKYMSRFAEIGTELQAASDFIQSQTEMFAEKIETFEEKCGLQLDEGFKSFDLKLKEIILKKQEKTERVISEKISEIKIELNNQTKELDNSKNEGECLSSKLNVIQKTANDIPIRKDTLEKEMKTIKPEPCTHDLLLVDQITDDNEKVSGCLNSQVSTQTQAFKDVNTKFDFYSTIICISY
ncbi:hypothetical protein Btru_058461 [Bulinus truncatus]|nr:hypothetical protein Btru_058461 [Bulinus truncatus]